MSLALGIGLGPGFGQGGLSIQPLVYEPEAVTYFTALEGTGLALTDARKYTLNRGIKRLKAAGLHSKISVGGALGNTDSFAIDMFGHLTPSKVGTPSFANNAVSVSSNASYYDLGVEFNEIDPVNHSMGILVRSGSAGSSSWDMGVYDGSSLRCAFNARNTSNLFHAGSFTAAATLGTTAQASGTGFSAISRHPGTPGSYYSAVNGIQRASAATAAGTSASTNHVRIFVPGGLTTFSARAIAWWFFGDGLTQDEMVLVYAILKSMDNAIVYGEPQIQDAGFGDAIVQADVVVIGLSVGAVIAAYQAKREGLTVVLVGEERDSSHEHIGFNPVSWIDAGDPLTVNGLCRAIITAANTQLGVADTTDQQGMSVHSVRWNRFARQMLDPTRTAPLDLPGADIPVYFSEGLASAKMETTAIGRECTELRTVDGRIFRPLASRMIVINGDYDGNIFPLTGISYTKGTEARGSAPGEDLNGYDPAALFPFRDLNGVTYSGIDPYVTEGNAASGLLPTVIDLPSITDGDPDPTLQAFCYRLITTSQEVRRAPMTGGATLAPSPDYDPLKFEPLGRIFTAYAATPHTPALGDCYAIGHAIEGAGSAAEDWNNGNSGYSIDMGQLAAEWLFSETKSARMAAIEKLTNFTRDFAYWILASGDPRIPAGLVTALTARGLDTAWGVDPYPGHPLFFPPYLYKREPRFQPRNTFNFSGNDTFMTDGTTPRSIKTVACGSYRADKHTTRWVNVAGELFRQGGLDDSSAGGVNQRSPLPLEAIVPDKAECANLISPVALFVTKVANSSLRMEPVFQLAGQASGIIAKHALTDGVAVQDIDYPAFRTAFLAIPDAVAPVLPQTN